MITASPVPEGVGWNPAVHFTSRDVRISRRALGTLMELLSYPPGWDMNADKLAKLGREGREATRKAMRELEDAGYVIHLVYRGPGGRMLTASFAGNLPAVARALADAWLEENAHLNAKQKPSSHRGTADRASVDQASVHRASADRTSADRASSIRQTEETERKTDSKIDKNTPQNQPPPPAAAATPPEWFPAESEGVVVQEEGEDGTDAAAERAPARKVVDFVADAETMKQAKLFVDKLPHDRRPSKLEHAELAHFASAWLVEGWSQDTLMVKCVTGLDKMDNRISVWRFRLDPKHVVKQPSGLIPNQRNSGRTEPCREGECDGHDHPKCELGWITLSNKLAHCPCSPMSKTRAAAGGHQTYQDPDPSTFRAPKDNRPRAA